MKELMNNPYAWLFLSLITIFSFAFAIYTWIEGKKAKELSNDYLSNDIIKKRKQPISKLKIEFDGKIINDLTATTFYIWNSGNEIINKADIVGNSLKLVSDSGAILDARIIKQTDESNEFRLITVSSSNIEFDFDYIDGGEGVRIQVLHTGSGNKISFVGKIKGGKAIRNCKDQNNGKGIHGFIKAFIDELVPMLIFIFCWFGTMFIAHFLGLDSNSGIIVALAGALSVIVVLIYVKIKRKIRHALHRDIPINLKRLE